MAANATSAGPGNQLAVKHGARSEAIVAFNTPPVVAEVQEALSAGLPYLEPVDRFVVEGLARKLAQRRLIWEFIDRLGGSLIDARGRPRGCWQMLASLDRQILAELTAAGATPAARAALMGDVAGARRDAAAVNTQRELAQEYGQQRVPSVKEPAVSETTD